MFRFVPVTALLVACVHAADLPTPVVDNHITAQVWSAGVPRRGFVLVAPERVAADLARSAAPCGYEVRPATADDLSSSLPILGAREELDGRGGVRVTWDLSSAQRTELVDFWVELLALQAAGAEVGPAATTYLASAL